MKTTDRIARVLISVGGGLFISLLITLLVWNVQIEGRAFQCTDDVGFGLFWEKLSNHERAGDKLSSGWTWQKLRVARLAYTTTFYLIWVASALSIGQTLQRRVGRTKFSATVAD